MIFATLSSIISILCLAIGILPLFLRKGSLSSWFFFIGMLLLAGELFFEQLALRADQTDSNRLWAQYSMWAYSFSIGPWLAFSLVYGRGNTVQTLREWFWILTAGFLVPPTIVALSIWSLLTISTEGIGQSIRFLPAGKTWLILAIVFTLATIVNLERTLRASVGIGRWRIKYIILGLMVIFGVKVYAMSQMVLYSAYDPTFSPVATIGVILGCGFIAIGQIRSGISQVELYPSRAVLKGSITIILAGAYFLIVGVLAQLVKVMGGVGKFPAQAIVVLVGFVGITVFLLSDRFRSGLQHYVSHHFQRAEHDFRRLWTEFTHRTSSMLDDTSLAIEASEVISKNFQVLGVSVFRSVSDPPALHCLHTTEDQRINSQIILSNSEFAQICALGSPFNLEKHKTRWASSIRGSCPNRFNHGGDRLAIPLVASEQLVGIVILADRVCGASYSQEEIDLFACIGDQLAGAFLNHQLTEKILRSRELEAFQTISTFFVHDLRNAANSLSLTLENLPFHFDDPIFRADAVKSVRHTTERINQTILKLSSLRHDLQLRLLPCRLDLVCIEAMDGLDLKLFKGSSISRDVHEVPPCDLDRGAIQSVIINLLFNAHEAITGRGNIKISVQSDHERIRMTVSDNGIGMSSNFIKEYLFRPFYSTKTKGLGIGMFQCKKIIEAHQGSIAVESSPNQGTCFSVYFPIISRTQ